MEAAEKRRVLAIGDIHGCFAALEALDEGVPIQPEDRVIAVGDFIDRGPRSRDVIDWLITRHREGGLVPILGNHEEMMLRAADDRFARDCWLRFGGVETLASYGVDAPFEVRDIPGVTGPDHWRFLVEDCLDCFETDTHFFVHANADPDLPLSEQPGDALRWHKFSGGRPHLSGKTMICGHTPQLGGQPLDLGFAVCIDTGIYLEDGWLTCLDIATDNYWQANNSGAIRTGKLGETSAASAQA